MVASVDVSEVRKLKALGFDRPDTGICCCICCGFVDAKNCMSLTAFMGSIPSQKRSSKELSLVS